MIKKRNMDNKLTYNNVSFVYLIALKKNSKKEL